LPQGSGTALIVPLKTKAPELAYYSHAHTVIVTVRPLYNVTQSAVAVGHGGVRKSH
jgi:hypothetical protein